MDELTGYRYYSAGQLSRLHRILALKDLGLSLDQIASLLKEETSTEQISGMLRLKSIEVGERVAEEQLRLARVEALLRQIEQEGKMPMYEVALRRIPTQNVAAIRRTLPNYGGISGLFGELFGSLGGKVKFLGPTIGIYHDPEFREQDVDAEVAIPAEGDLPTDAPVQMRALPGGEMARVIYRGRYEGIGGAYNALVAGLEPNGCRIAGPVREVYLHGPGDAQDPSEYVTEIQVPVERAQ